MHVVRSPGNRLPQPHVQGYPPGGVDGPTHPPPVLRATPPENFRDTFPWEPFSGPLGTHEHLPPRVVALRFNLV